MQLTDLRLPQQLVDSAADAQLNITLPIHIKMTNDLSQSNIG